MYGRDVERLHAEHRPFPRELENGCARCVSTRRKNVLVDELDGGRPVLSDNDSTAVNEPTGVRGLFLYHVAPPKLLEVG